MSAPKFPPVHPIAQRVDLPAGTPVNIYVYPGLTYMIGRRGDDTGSTYEVVSLLRNVETGAIDEDSALPLELFTEAGEDTFVTSGDVVRVTRTHGDGAEAPVLRLSLINIALSR